MACFRPLVAYRSLIADPDGKRGIVFKSEDGLAGTELKLPCGKCVGCLTERSRQWAIRCLHESKLHVDNCFLTLTYDDDHLPENGSVNVRVMQLFMKSFRQKISPIKIRFFACGEYGKGLGRPHYHLLIFGFDFPDKVLEKKNGDHNLYSSRLLSSLWTSGFSLLGEVSFDSAAYVARYVLKKKFGDDADAHYIDSDTGEVGGRNPEFITMSRRPGIGADWFLRFKDDFYSSVEDGVTVNGSRFKPPAYYDKLLKAVDVDLFDDVKLRRMDVSEAVIADSTPRRLRDREEVASARMDLFNMRSYENGS